MTETEIATVHRYQASDEGRSGIPDGTLIACVDAEYDDEHGVRILFSLPDLKEVDAVTFHSDTDLSDELGFIAVAEVGDPEWRKLPTDGGEVAALIAKIEAAEAATRAEEEASRARVVGVLADPQLFGALRTLRDAGVTREEYAEMVRSLDRLTS